jgi:dihydroxyacetone kinase
LDFLAHQDQLKFSSDDTRAVVRADAKTKERVSIITGGGYGHLPTFLGYVGPGFCDGVAVGNVFTSPSGETIANAAMETETGKGVLLLFANYVGDCLNFQMAKDILEMQDIQVGYVKASDDVASAGRENKNKRRGIAGIYFAYKTAGAKAESGASLEEVIAVAEKACERISTVGFAFSPCKIPGRTAPVFHLEDDEMELGMGIHGEPGVSRTKLKSSKEIAKEIIDMLAEDQDLKGGEEVAVLVNGLGGTSREELYILYRDAKAVFDEKKIRIHKAIVGEYATSMEMLGASISILVLDDELKRLLDVPGNTPFIK